MENPDNPLTRWIAQTAEAGLRNVNENPDASQIAALEQLIAERLRQMPMAALEQLWSEKLAAEKARQLRAFEHGESARLWELGVAEAVRVNGFPAVMAQSRDPERLAIGKKWFESVAGALLETDLVELKTGVTLPRHMLVVRVQIELPRDANPEAAYAVLEGRVLRPYQISPTQRFYPGDSLRKISDDELTQKELRALERARVMLKKQTAL